MADYRNVWMLVASVTLLQLGGGVLGVLTPIGLDAFGVGTFGVGVVAALFSIGFMGGAWYATPAIRAIGNIRVHAAGGAVMAITIQAMFLVQDVWSWSLIRLVQGAAMALMFSSIEAWLGAAMPANKRGSISGFYHLMAKAALIIGPFFVAGMPALMPHPYIWGSIFLCFSLMPLCLTRREQPPVPDTDPLSMKQLFSLSPSAVFAIFIAGLVNTGLLSLLPIYAKSELSELGLTATSLAALAVAAVWMGGMISQWPAGRVSDHIDRRYVIAAMVAIASLAALVLGMGTDLSPYLTLFLVWVWGAGALSYYGIAAAHIIDWCPPGKIAQAMAGILFVWALGSVIGPLLAGGVMLTPFGPRALFLLAAIFGLFLTGIMLFRRTVRAEPPETGQEPWMPTTPLLAAKGEVDPRPD
ncbi:MAG: MFS transporter [Henriciella sp.]